MASFDSDSFDVNSFDVGSFFLSSLFSVGGYSGGTLVDSAGVVQIVLVAADYTPQSTDVYILGTLHRNDGAMYCTTAGTAEPEDTRINSLRHTEFGVRYIVIDAVLVGENQISKGFINLLVGTQYVTTTVSGNIENGILRSNSEEMVVAELV